MALDTRLPLTTAPDITGFAQSLINQRQNARQLEQADRRLAIQEHQAEAAEVERAIRDAYIFGEIYRPHFNRAMQSGDPTQAISMLEQRAAKLEAEGKNASEIRGAIAHMKAGNFQIVGRALDDIKREGELRGFAPQKLGNSRLIAGAEAEREGFRPGTVVEETAEGGYEMLQSAPTPRQPISLRLPDGTVFTLGEETPTTDEDARALIEGPEDMAQVLNFVRSVEENPGTVGIRGAFGQAVGGAVGGVSDELGAQAQAGITGADAQVAQAIRMQSGIIAAENMRRVIAEQGSRISDTERRIAESILRNMETLTSPTQIKGSMGELVTLILVGDANARRRQGVPGQIYDLGTDQGLRRFIEDMSESGFSEGMQERMLQQYSQAQGLDY